MTLTNNFIAVDYEFAHGKVMGTGAEGKELIRAERWLDDEIPEDENHGSRFDENRNYLETNPQICVVRHSNHKLGYKTGDRLFVSYMAWEWAEITEYGYVIDTDFIFFRILADGTFGLSDDLYLGEAVYSTESTSKVGLISLGDKKDSLRVRLTHVPPNHKEHYGFGIGDIVVSIDQNNYEFDYWGKKYIKFTRHEIVSKIYGKAS